MVSYWERRAEETRRRRLAQAMGVPPSGLMSEDEQAQERLREQFPADPLFAESGTGVVRTSTPEEQAQTRADIRSFIFGPERRSVFGGEAGLTERFVRDWGLSEQEFRLAGESAREGRVLPAVGWAGLGLAGAVPFVGDVAQGAARAGRWAIPPSVDDLTRSTLEFQRAAGMSLDEALESVNRTRQSQGLEPISAARESAADVGRGEDVSEAVEPVAGAAVDGVAGVTTRGLERASEADAAGSLGRSPRIQEKNQIPGHDAEKETFQRALEERRANFYRRLNLASDETAISALPVSGPGLKDTPASRLSNDLQDTFYEMRKEIRASLQSSGVRNRRPGEAVAVRFGQAGDPRPPVNWMAKNAPEALKVVEGVLMRAVSGGRGSNVAYKVLSDGEVLNGGALRGKYIVSSVTEDFMDTPLWSYSDTSLANELGRRGLFKDLDSILRDIGPSIEKEKNPVLYFFNTAEPGYVGATSNRTTDFFESTYLDYDKLPYRMINARDDRRLIITGGDLVDGREAAFAEAAARGQKFVRDAMSGSLVEVPEKYFSGVAKTVDGISLPPLGPNRSIIPELTDDFYDRVDPIADVVYSGRGSGDAALAELYKVLKFDEPTVMIDSVQAERLIPMGYMPLFRGIDVSMIMGAMNQPWRVLRDRLGSTMAYVRLVEDSPLIEEEYLRFVPEFMRDPASNVYVSKVDYFQRTAAAYSDYKNTLVRPPRWDTSVNPDVAGRFRRERVMLEDFFAENGIDINLRSKEDFVRNFATGSHYAGTGSHGSGTYMTPNIERAMGYAETYDRPSSTEGVVIGALLRPDARIMGPNEHEEFLRILSLMGTRGIDGSDLTYSGNPLARQMQGIVRYETVNRIDVDDLARMASDELPSGQLSTLGVEAPEAIMHEVFMDHGRLIAALGYDGFVPHSSVYGYNRPEYVILNRKSLLVIDQPVEPIVFSESGWRLRD